MLQTFWWLGKRFLRQELHRAIWTHGLTISKILAMALPATASVAKAAAAFVDHQII